METTIRLFCSMSLKIAKCRQQQPLTYDRPHPSSSAGSFRTHPLLGQRLPVKKDQFLRHFQFITVQCFCKCNENKLEMKWKKDIQHSSPINCDKFNRHKITH